MRVLGDSGEGVHPFNVIQHSVSLRKWKIMHRIEWVNDRDLQMLHKQRCVASLACQLGLYSPRLIVSRKPVLPRNFYRKCSHSLLKPTKVTTIVSWMVRPRCHWLEFYHNRWAERDCVDCVEWRPGLCTRSKRSCPRRWPWGHQATIPSSVRY